MAINKKLIHFDTLSSFQGANGINTSSMASMDESTFNGATRNVPFRSIVFIKDRNLIWTHGTYYKGTDTQYTPLSFTIGGTAYNLYTSNNSGVNLDNLYSKAIKIVIDATNLLSLDVNTALSGGGAAYNYSSITKWINAPTNMKYGQIIQLTEKDLLGAQLAFESEDSTYAAGRLWYRTYRTAERPQGQGSIQAWGEWALILTDKNISDFAMTSHQTFTELNTKLSSAGEVCGIRNSKLVLNDVNVSANANLYGDNFKEGLYFVGPIGSGSLNYPATYGSAIRMYRYSQGSNTGTRRTIAEIFVPTDANTLYFRNSWNNYDAYTDGGTPKQANPNIWNDWYEVYHEGNLKFNYNQTATDRKVLKDANNNLYVTIPNWIGLAAGSEHVPIYLNNSGTPTVITDILLVNDNTNNKQVSVQNNNGSVGIFVSSNRGLYDFTNSKWIIYNTKNDGNNNYHTYILKWKNIGSSTNPIYFNADGEPQASTYSFTTTIPDGTSDNTTIPTSKAVWGAIDRGFDVNNALVFIGTYSGLTTSSTVKTGTGTFTPTFVNDDVKKGWVWIVSDITNGEYFGNIRVEIGDLIIAADDEPGTNISKYYLILKNIDPTIYVTLATTLTITGQKTFNSTNTIFNKNVLLNGQTDIASAQVGNLQVSGLTSFAQVAYGCTPDSTAANNELVTAEWIKNKILNIGTVTVSGEKTIWGATYVNSNKVLLNVEGSLTIPNGQYLYTGSISTNGKGIVFYESNSNFFGAWGEFSSSLNIPTYIRSTGSDNLYHRYRNSSGTTLDKIIIDENNLGGSFTESKRYPIKFDTTSKKLYVDVSWTDNNSATATDAILDGSNDGTAIKYEPYSADTAILSWVNNNSNAGKLYFGELNPSKTTRLNYNGYFYASKLYSNGYETITTNTISNYTSNYLTKPSADKKVWGQTYIDSDGDFKDVTGDITLVASGTSNTPRIIYQRGTATDQTYDFYAGVNYNNNPYYTIGATYTSSGTEYSPTYFLLTTTVGTAYLGDGVNKILTSSNSSVSMDDANTSMTVKINDISKILRLGWYAISPSVTITESGVEKTYDMFYLSSGWYRILNIKTYPASFILTFYNVYNTYEPAGISFLISCGYTHATITQLNERCAVSYPTILKLRVIQNGNGKFYIDFYYNNVSYSVGTPTKGNRLRYHVTPLDTLIRDSSKIELIDFTALSNDLTSLAEYIVTLYPFGNTYSTTDTKNTAGITNSTDKLYLIGTKTLTGDYAQTYSNSDVYVISGVLNLKASQYADTKDTGSLDLHNSDIYGVNSIKFSDKSNNAAEGLQWYRDDTHIDSFWISDGVIYFTPNREWGTTGTSYTVLHTNNAKWANLSVSTSLIYNTEPEFGSVTIGNGTPSLTATKKCKLIYDATNQCLKFIFV